jgi:hypothetical protein
MPIGHWQLSSTKKDFQQRHFSQQQLNSNNKLKGEKQKNAKKWTNCPLQ